MGAGACQLCLFGSFVTRLSAWVPSNQDYHKEDSLMALEGDDGRELPTKLPSPDRYPHHPIIILSEEIHMLIYLFVLRISFDNPIKKYLIIN